MAKSNIKITVDATELDAKLSKSMKNLGVYYDQYGRLMNKEGEFVAGLSQARIRMGEYIDAMGRMRNANGDLIDGLTSGQKKLRMYIDELGNVRTLAGDFVAFSQDRLAQIDAETKAKLAEVQCDADMKTRLKSEDEGYTKSVRENCRKRMEEIVAESARKKSEANKQAEVNKAAAEERAMARSIGSGLSSAAGSVANMANQLSTIVALVGKGDKGFNNMAKTISITGQAVGQFVGTANTVANLIQIYRNLQIAMQGASAAQIFLNAVSGNWVALAVGGIVAGTTALGMYASMAEEGATGTDQMVDATDRLGRAWAVVVEKMQDAKIPYEDAIKAGVETMNQTPAQILESELDKLRDAKRELQDFAETPIPIVYPGFQGAPLTVKFITPSDQAIRAEEQILKIPDTELKLINAFDQKIEYFLPQKESERLQELYKELTLMAVSEVATADQKIQIESAIVEAERQIAEAKKKEAEDAVSKWFKSSDSADMIDLVAEREKILATQGKSEAEKQVAINRLTKAYNDQTDKMNSDFASSAGFAEFRNTNRLSQTLDDLNKEIESWRDAAKLEGGYWTTETGKADLNAAIVKATEDFQEEQERLRRKAADEFGFGRYKPVVNNDVTTDVGEMEATISRWRESVAASGDAFWKSADGQAEMEISIAEYRKKCDEKREDLAKQRTDRLDTLWTAWGLGVETPETRYKQRLAELTELIGDDVELQKRKKHFEDALLDKKNEEIAIEADNQAQEEARARDQRLSELGITRLREQSKTALERYVEEQNNLTTALREGFIDRNEFSRLQTIIDQEYQSMVRDKENRRLEKIASYTPPPSMTAGSQELYSALTRNNTDVWRSSLLKNVVSLDEATGQSVKKLQAIQDNVNLMFKKMGVL